ncbi:MAG: hypothetical protein ACE5DL_02420 [Nitrosopumilaceae archaeon]
MSQKPKNNDEIDLQTNKPKNDEKQYFNKHHDSDDWKRLEKWQIGRRRFC